MTAKSDILTAIRRHRLDAADLPELDDAWITYSDQHRQFAQMLESVGGRCIAVTGVDALNRELAALEAYAAATKICSAIEGIERTNVNLESIDDPHALEDVDFGVVAGEFCVAENGAVWVSEAGLTHRAVLFLVQHLALVVAADEVIDNMHQAYERLAGHQAGAAKLAASGFGLFISGPSKTADIEQSLVIGAHGPRSLTVFLVDG